MRKIMLFAMLTMSSALLHAAEKNNNLFNCVESEKLALNPDCMASKIESNNQFIETMNSFTVEQQDLGGNVMATLRFFPEKMLIEVIAQDEYQKKSQMAAVNHDNHKQN
ncbi:MAG: hypothetical protein GJ680_06600 [Alteromonadaceae bacterium]|nr:hypothetical protein [Alteromonadaceae bacterium]